MRSPGRPEINQRLIKQAFWAHISAGLQSDDAARACGVSQPLGPRWFRQAGGIAPTNLGSTLGIYLSFAEREEISHLHAQQLGVREIARRLERSPSTISRELRRNAATRCGKLQNRATVAQWKAERAAERPKVTKLANNDKLRAYVQERLGATILDARGKPLPGPQVPWNGRRHGRRADRRWGKGWSSEQISQRLRFEFPDDASMQVSHEAIYQALYIQGRGALKRELTACLRTGRALRVPQARTRQRGRQFITPELMISERPAEIDDRAKKEGEQFDETDELFLSAESHPYSQGKFLANQSVSAFVAANPNVGFEIVSISPVFVFGKALSSRADSSSMGLQFFMKNKILTDAFVNMLFEANPLCAIVDVADVAEAVYKAAITNGIHGKTYLISSESYTTSDVHSMLNGHQPKHQAQIVYSSERAKKELGLHFKPVNETLRAFSV